MASKNEGQKGKKRQKIDESSDDYSSNESDSEDVASHESFDENMEIPVEFEAFPPAECDFNAMRNLLKQLFLKSSVDLSELADIIISQKKIGSIIKVVDEDEEEENEKEEQKEQNGPSTSSEEDYEEEILGLITMLDLMKYKEKKCIQQIKELLLEKCKASDDQGYGNFKEIMNGDKVIGLLFSERFINIPPQVALPLYKALRTELQHHYKKDKSSSLDYLVLISKSFREKEDSNSANSSNKKGKKLSKKAKKGQELNFSNAEDEILYKESVMSFSYPAVVDNNDTLIGGKWGYDDTVLIPYRTVMVVPYKHLNDIIEQMESLLAS